MRDRLARFFFRLWVRLDRGRGAGLESARLTVVMCTADGRRRVSRSDPIRAAVMWKDGGYYLLVISDSRDVIRGFVEDALRGNEGDKEA